MKVKNIIFGALSMTAAMFLFAACGGDNTATEVQVSAAEPAVPAEPAEAAAEPEATSEPIVITGNDRMQFSPKQFTVAAGSEVEVVFHNAGTMPKAAMGHNLVILQKGVEAVPFATASMAHQANDYVAPTREAEVIAHTKILGPDEKETLTFTAPTEPGEYTFICTFPGHTAAGMVGTMIVE